jgi:hypothetical protein
LQKSPNSNARWEMAVPNGTYNVRLVAGDPKHFDSVYRTNVEGTLGLSGTPTNSVRWIDSTVQVTVTDGRLTVTNAAGAQNNKLAFLEITQVGAASPPPSAPTGIVGVYAFNEGSGTTAADASASNNAGSLNAGVTWTASRTGAGAALSFNGSSGFVNLARNANQWLGGTGSAAFWLRTTQVGNNSAWRAPGVLGVESAGNSNDVFWGWLDASGRIGIQAGDTPGAKSASPINDGQWHHVALTRNAATGAVQVYVDGKLSGSATSAAGVKTTPFRSIGRIEDTAGTPAYLAGSLDDLRLYNRVLTAAEIQGLIS